jgi:hypothetical protein
MEAGPVRAKPQAASLNYLRQGASEPSPFQIVERAGPLAHMRAVLNAPPAQGFHDPRGFWEPRPILPESGSEPYLPPAISQKILDGVPLTDRELDAVIFGMWEE